MFAVLIPVGPDPRDVERLNLLVQELARFEDRGQIRLIVIDDAPCSRGLAIDWPEVHVVRTPLWNQRSSPDPLSAHVAGTVEGLAAAGDAEFVVKLDTDVAVIGRFSGQLREVFADAQLGVVGSYDITADGGVRDWSVWEQTVRRASWPVAVARTPTGWRIWRRTRRQRAAVREIRNLASRVAPVGAHCLGGAYAVSRSFLQRARLDWRPWVRTRLGEDVVVGLLCSHARLRMRSLTSPGQPFALSWRGLPASPEELVAAGYSIVHSVKQDDPHEELRLRERFHQLAAGWA